MTPGRLVLFSSLIFFGCTSNNSTPAHAPSIDETNRIAASTMPVESKTIAQKTPEFARLAVLQISHAFESFDFAVNNQVDARMVMTKDNTGLNFGCRIMTKFSPSFERSFDTNVERLQVSFVKCTPEDFAGDQSASANLTGGQEITIVYDKPYPRASAPELVLGYPTSVDVTTAPMDVEIFLKNGARLKVRRTSTVMADRIEERDDSMTYLIKSEVTDTFEQFNNGISVRRGTSVITLDDFKFQVKKASPRLVTDISGGRIGVKVTGEKIHVDGSSTPSSINNMEPFSFDFGLRVAGALALPSSVCMPPSGAFQVIKGQATTVRVDQDGVKVDTNDTMPAKICEQPDDFFYSEEFQSAYR